MRRSLLTTIAISFCFLFIHAQQDVQFSMYSYNGIYLNPGYTGSHDAVNATAVYRKQWVNVPGAPQSATVSIHSPLKNKRLALGVIYSFDQIGVTKSNSADAIFAYRVPIGKNKDIRLCFGLSAGFHHYQTSMDNVPTTDPNDPAFVGNSQKRWLPDAKFGVYVYSHRFFTGVSLSHIFTNRLTGKNYIFETNPLIARQYYNLNIHAGYVMDVSKKVKFLPSMLLKYTPAHAPITFDFNICFIFIDRIWVGAGYRLNDCYNFMASTYVTKSLRIGYAYDLTVSPLKSATTGSHEVLVGVDFAVIKGKLRSPETVRYF